MAKRLYKDRVFTERTVLDAALERMNHVFDNYDRVAVSFSGGKDSTAVLNIALKVARERGKLPLRVIFFDEEVNSPPTLEYVMRMRECKDIDLQWYCLEFKHRNGCTMDSDGAWWYCWDKNKRDLWCSEIPDFAITEHPAFKKGMMYTDFINHTFDRGEMVAICTGIRAEESPRRQNMAMSKKHENYIFVDDHFRNVSRVIPIYDWSRNDVWRLVKQWNLDYNKHYDLINMTDLNGMYLKQRVTGNPFGEEPLRSAWIYSECFPDLFRKMLKRVEGFETAWRYSNTDLYLGGTKPQNITWREYFELIVSAMDNDMQFQIRENVKNGIKMHFNKTDDPIHDEMPHPLSGFSWKFLCSVALRGDLKGRYMQKVIYQSFKNKETQSKTLSELKQQYGKRDKSNK